MSIYRLFSRYKLPHMLLVTAIIVFSSCANRQELAIPPQDVYDLGADFMDRGRYQPALTQFNLLKTRFPLSPYLEITELEIISANYAFGEYEEAEFLARRFIEFYPNSQHLDYAYFMAARSEYAQGSNILNRFRERDLSAAKNAYATFSNLVSLFPSSIYATESLAHMRHIRNVLAENEFRSARFYFNRFSYVASIIRCQNIILNYPASPYNLQALELMAAAYRRLGWDDQAEEVTQLAQNYQE